MMVIQGTLPADSFGTHAASVVFHLPADRCLWSQTYTPNAGDERSGNYEISNAFVIGTSSSIAITNPVLGFIGKSGRFVAITD